MCIRDRYGDDVREIISETNKIFPLSKLTNYLVRALDTQCIKTKTECLKYIRELIKKHGLNVITARDIKYFGKMLSQGDAEEVEAECISSVSYTHLTLPTICSV
eukprot:TRINITY_DN14626_c0_g1_i3.p1 TRINITY_DN14626_c0_g1~~TRINITY_DN14626_c0_g1_i3.p1  ORF type:complete len:104 (+),score=21.49 TRINITY_DN14626_c0_g1_i3:60-371(+)